MYVRVPSIHTTQVQHEVQPRGFSHQAKAREEAYRQPIETLNPAQPELFQQDAMWPLFKALAQGRPRPLHARERLRHWSITKYNDIMAVDTNHQVFSSEPSITIVDPVLAQGPADVHRHGPA